MADSMRIVRFTAGGQIEELLHVQSSLDYSITNMGFVRDSLAFERGERNQRMVKSGSRYGGERYAGESLANGTYKFQILTSGPTHDALLDRISRLIGELERVPGQHYIEHKADGATYPSYYEVRAPAQFQPNYNWAQAQGAGSMVTDVSWPVAPLVCGAPMDVTDTFATDTLSEYTFDEGDRTNVDVNLTPGSNYLQSIASPTAEVRLIHTERGYGYGDQEVTISGRVGSTLDGFKAGVILKRTSPDTYIEAYIDDNGTDSRIRIDEVIDGVRTNKSTANLANRLVTSANFYFRAWARSRQPVLGLPREVKAVYRKSATGDFTPIGATGDDTTYYTPSGAGLTAFWGTVRGQAGLSWIPMHSGARITNFYIRPFSQRNIAEALYSQTYGGGTIPGDAPSKCAVTLGIAGASGGCAFGMFAWSENGTENPDGMRFHEAETLTLTGWAGAADGTASSALVAQDTSASAATTYRARVTTDIRDLPPDDDDPSVTTIELWARVKMSSTLVEPRLVASVRRSTATWSPEVFTSEYGREGKVLTVPLSGTRYRMARIGTLRIPRDDNDANPIGSTGFYRTIDILGPLGTGSSGTWGIDYIYWVRPYKRALSPTGKPNDADYPKLLRSNTEIRRTFNSDLSGMSSDYWNYGGMSDAGLCGAPIEINPCDDFLLMTKISTLVPDDPTIDDTTESLFHNYSISLGVIPRWHYQRPN